MPIRTVGVIGTGTMGAGIIQVVAAAGLRVIALDVSHTALAKGMLRLTENLERETKAGRMEMAARDAILAAITLTVAYEDLAETDIVIEACIEDAEAKRRVIGHIDMVVRASTIIASTTSSISITKLAACASVPSRFVGMHFFNPVPRMGLVEVVRGLQTSDAASDSVTALAQRLGKAPITVKNTPGFVVNRILIPMINEALFLLEEGDASAEEIDQGLKMGCNHPMGPLALADMIGLDVLLSVMNVLHAHFSDSKYRPCPLLKEFVDAGYLGRKSGRGIYRY